MVDVLRALWLAQLGIVLPAFYFSVRERRTHPRFQHIRLMASSYVILTAIDVYTILIEGYDPISPKAIGMLIAFVLGDMTLLRMLMNPSEDPETP